MFRRIYFLLPNAKLAQKVVDELVGLNVSHKNIHTYAEHKLPIASLNPATENQTHNEAREIEKLFWNGNLLLFFIFSGIATLALIFQQYSLALLSLAVMLVSFTAGDFFVKHIPHIHLENFKNATSHNELLMMIDVPAEKVGYIENTIHRHHPAAVEGGSSWAIKSIDI